MELAKAFSCYLPSSKRKPLVPLPLFKEEATSLKALKKVKPTFFSASNFVATAPHIASRVSFFVRRK
jgi:hypothetical protein